MYVDCNKVELFPSVQEEDCGWELSKKAADFLGAGQVHYYQTLSSLPLNSLRFALKVVGNICFMNESWWWDNCWWCGAAHSWQVDCNRSLQPLQIQQSVPELDAAPTLPLLWKCCLQEFGISLHCATLAQHCLSRWFPPIWKLEVGWENWDLHRDLIRKIHQTLH